jgi:hypothetical protein
MVKASLLVHGATKCKGDNPTFAAFMATPVTLAQIVKRLTADKTEFCGGVEDKWGTAHQQRGTASEQKHVLAASRVQAWSGSMTAGRYPSRRDHSRDSETAGGVPLSTKDGPGSGFPKLLPERG